MSGWYYFANGGRFGPVSEEKLVELARSGSFTTETLISPEDHPFDQRPAGTMWFKGEIPAKLPSSKPSLGTSSAIRNEPFSPPLTAVIIRIVGALIIATSLPIFYVAWNGSIDNSIPGYLSFVIGVCQLFVGSIIYGFGVLIEMAVKIEWRLRLLLDHQTTKGGGAKLGE